MPFVVVVALIAGLADVVGGYLTVLRPLSPRSVDQLTALATGFLLGGAFFDLLPEAMEQEPAAPLYIALGYVILFVTGHLFARHSHGHVHEALGEHSSMNLNALDCHRNTPHPLVGKPHGPEPLISKSASLAALVGLLLHTFFDGAAIAAAFRHSGKLGILVLIAVFLHKLPEGFSLSAIMLAAARGRLLAFWSAVALGLSTVIGALAVLYLKAPSATAVFLSLATGSFLYLGASDMIPVTTAKSRENMFLVILGGTLVYILTVILHDFGLE